MAKKTTEQAKAELKNRMKLNIDIERYEKMFNEILKYYQIMKYGERYVLVRQEMFSKNNIKHCVVVSKNNIEIENDKIDDVDIEFKYCVIGKLFKREIKTSYIFLPPKKIEDITYVPLLNSHEILYLFKYIDNLYNEKSKNINKVIDEIHSLYNNIAEMVDIDEMIKAYDKIDTLKKVHKYLCNKNRIFYNEDYSAIEKLYD